MGNSAYRQYIAQVIPLDVQRRVVGQGLDCVACVLRDGPQEEGADVVPNIICGARRDAGHVTGETHGVGSDPAPAVWKEAVV